MKRKIPSKLFIITNEKIFVLIVDVLDDVIKKSIYYIVKYKKGL